MQLHYLTGPNGLFAIFVKDSINGNAMHYILKDHIGSINYVIDTAGIIEEEMNFDAWGNRRNPTSWSYSAIPTNYMFDRGFTLHEHLDDFKLINMNGRVYDPVLARFLSPDPVLQMPEYSQNFNRYSYALNNPLKYTDPSGFVIEGDDELIKITNNSPIKIPDNVFTNGKAARQAAANEELFGKIKSGFGKDDRVKTELTDVAASERGAKENITYTAGPYTSWTGVIGQTAELGAKDVKNAGAPVKFVGKWATRVGWGGEIVANIINGINVYHNQTWSNYGKLAISLGTTAINFIPYVGPTVSFGLSAYDTGGGFNNFYNTLDKKQELYKNTGIIFIPSILPVVSVPMPINLNK